MPRCQRACLAACLAPALALTVSGCVSDNAGSPLVILRNLAPASGCVLDTGSDTYFSSGFIQDDSPTGYLFTPLVRNDLETTEGEVTTSKTIFIEGARVELTFYDDTLFDDATLAEMRRVGLTRYQTPISGSIEPDGGLATFGFEVVPAGVISAVAEVLGDPTPLEPTSATVIDAAVRVFGRRGGGEVESNVFHYPVQVCHDCVFDDVGACAALPAGYVPQTGGACNPYQDGAIDCCTDTTGNQVCPPPSGGS